MYRTEQKGYQHDNFDLSTSLPMHSTVNNVIICQYTSCVGGADGAWLACDRDKLFLIAVPIEYPYLCLAGIHIAVVRERALRMMPSMQLTWTHVSVYVSEISFNNNEYE